MTTFEILRLFVAIVAIYAVPAAICWYLVDRKIRQIESQIVLIRDLFNICTANFTNINTRLRNIK